MIIDLRGTSGSGKSTAARRLITEYSGQPVALPGATVAAYRLPMPHGRTLHILGRYTSPTGGCDTIPDMDEVIKRINYFATMGDVLYEGLRTSGVYGRLGINSEQYGDRYVFGFLDTLLDQCMENVNLRRAARGALPLTDHKHTISKYRAVQNVRRNLEARGRRCVSVPYTHAPEYIIKELLYGL